MTNQHPPKPPQPAERAPGRRPAELTEPSQLPAWASQMRDACQTINRAKLTTLKPRPGDNPKPAAILMLFAGSSSWETSHVLLTRRAPAMRSHAGHVAFPGGRVDPADLNAYQAALRETREETSLDTNLVHPLGQLPDLFIPVSQFLVTTTVAWTPQPQPISPGDPNEVTSTMWVDIAQLLSPDTWRQTRHSTGHLGPAYDLPGLFVWGFTGGLLQKFLVRAGLSPRWQDPPVVPIPQEFGG